MRHSPLVLLVDAHQGTGFSALDCQRRFSRIYADMVAPVVTVHWGWPCRLLDDPIPEGFTQRERMLSALVFGMGTIPNPNPYWLKLDTDTIATGPGTLQMPEWFADSPALVASGWGYTKPADAIDRLDAWAANVPELAGRPLNLHPHPGSRRVCHPRIISWLCFVRTDFAQRCARFIVPEGQPLSAERRLPVPSQDTFHGYCAEVLGEKIVKPRFKRLGWDHCSNRGRMLEACAAQEGA